MHLYRSNINLKIDIPYSLPLSYVSIVFDDLLFFSDHDNFQMFHKDF